jgi:hypothetical protein
MHGEPQLQANRSIRKGMHVVNMTLSRASLWQENAGCQTGQHQQGITAGFAALTPLSQHHSHPTIGCIITQVHTCAPAVSCASFALLQQMARPKERHIAVTSSVCLGNIKNTCATFKEGHGTWVAVASKNCTPNQAGSRWLKVT